MIDIKDQSTGDWLPKQAMTTFFPSSWSDQTIINEITIAFNNKQKFESPNGTYWVGTSSGGILIKMYLKPPASSNGEIITAFPLY